MEHGDLEIQSEQHHAATISTDAQMATAQAVAPEPAADSQQAVTKEWLWQRLRKQPRETAAVVVLVVTAMIWLDSGDSNSKQDHASKTPDPMDGFESYLSEFETEDSSPPFHESAEPVDSQSPGSFGDELIIPPTQQPEFAGTVTANYGDSRVERGISSANYREPATTAAQYPGDADALTSPTNSTSSSGAESERNGPLTPPHRKVRFAGRIKPAN